MFSKVALLVAATLVAFVAATPVPTGSAQCNAGPVQCCDKVYQSQTYDASFVAALLGVPLQSITGAIGVQCSPVNVIGVSGGAQCSQQPVCCDSNHFEGLVAVGCSPVNV